MEDEILEAQVDNTSIDTENPTDEENEVVGTLEDTSEVVDNTSESTPEQVEPEVKTKTYTQEEVEKMMKARVERLENSQRKELQKYQNVIDALKIGMGVDTDDVSEINKAVRKSYKEQGIDIPESPIRLSERDEKILAQADADEIIASGEDEINRVANEIYKVPQEKRTVRERAIFEKLGEYMLKAKAEKQLEENGIDKAILDDDDFKKFASKFSSSTSLVDIHDMYQTMKATKEIKREVPPSTGSVKTTKSTEEIKEFYSMDELDKIPFEELVKNDNLMKAVDRSLAKHK